MALSLWVGVSFQYNVQIYEIMILKDHDMMLGLICVCREGGEEGDRWSLEKK